MPAEERGPDLRQTSKVTKPRRLAQGLTTPFVRVRRLQSPLQAKAKIEPAFRFIKERWLGKRGRSDGGHYQPQPRPRVCWCDAVDKRAPDIAKYLDEHLHEMLGSYTLSLCRADLPSAKA